MASNNKIRPVKRLMETSGKCSKEGLAYGQCVMENYSTISKDSCGQQFAQFKQCISKHMNGKVW